MSLEKVKLPPQAVDLEEVVLGTLLQFQYTLDDAMANLKPKVFYKNKHRLIFKAIEAVYLRGDGVDLMTVSQELRTMKKLEEVGGDFYIVELTQKVVSGANINFHSRILLQKFIQRELISNSNSIIKEAYEEGTDSLDLLDKAYSHLATVSNMLIKNKEIDIRELTAEIIDRGGKLYRNEIKSGIETPITNLTNRMGGWRDSELIIIAARPGMGKTAFALKAGWIAALKGIPVGFFSLEMSAEQLLSRLWSMDLEIENDKFTKTGLTPEDQKRILTRVTEFDKIPFHIDDSTSLTIQELTIKAKKLKKEKGIKMLIVDYLQLMSGNSNNREQEISKISRGLKLVAKELNIPVIALSQLSRSVEQRGGSKRPLLSDLRESGAIEQDADVVQFIYRPEYYGIEEWDDYDRTPCAGQAEYIIAKNRNGGLVRNRMKFVGKYTNFKNIDEDSDEDFDKEFIPPAPEPNSNLSDAWDDPKEEEDDMPF